MPEGLPPKSTPETLSSPNISRTNPKWLVSEGVFDENAHFPDEQRMADIHRTVKKTWKGEENEEVRKRLYFSEVILYALGFCNPSLFKDAALVKTIGEEVTQAVSDTIQFSEIERKQDFKAITDKMTDPALDTKTVPVMQALKKMQESGAIDYDSRVLMDAVVRALHIRQSKIT